jgi:hypothetical protein
MIKNGDTSNIDVDSYPFPTHDDDDDNNGQHVSYKSQKTTEDDKIDDLSTDDFFVS